MLDGFRAVVSTDANYMFLLWLPILFTACWNAEHPWSFSVRLPRHFRMNHREQLLGDIKIITRDSNKSDFHEPARFSQNR
jgi:hypothetical protein